MTLLKPSKHLEKPSSLRTYLIQVEFIFWVFSFRETNNQKM